MTCFQIGGGIAAVGGAFLCSRFLSRTLFGGEPETHPLEEWTQLGEEEAAVFVFWRVLVCLLFFSFLFFLGGS